MYEETFTIDVSEGVNQVIGQVCRFVPIWAPSKLDLLSEITKSDSKERTKQKVSGLPLKATRVVCVHSVTCIFICNER